MPIRTNRGRAAVYRRLWGWPMRSPKHLVISAVVVAAVVLAIGLIVPVITGPDGAGSASPGGASATVGARGAGAVAPNPGGSAGAGTSAAPTSLPTRLSGPQQTPTSAAPAPEALEVATRWAKAWVSHPEGITSEQWLAGLAPYTTEEYLAVMATVDPANVPATEVTGPAGATNSFTSSVKATVPTNGGTLVITVISTPQGWRVANYEQAA
jgi:hypothetical protein